MSTFRTRTVKFVDEHLITSFERWMLKRIARRIVIQSPVHEKNIIEYISIMKRCMMQEFNEDSVPELNSFFNDCVEKATHDQYLKYSNYPTTKQREKCA